jgi:hypothetical protein
MPYRVKDSIFICLLNSANLYYPMITVRILNEPSRILNCGVKDGILIHVEVNRLAHALKAEVTCGLTEPVFNGQEPLQWTGE